MSLTGIPRIGLPRLPNARLTRAGGAGSAAAGSVEVGSYTGDGTTFQDVSLQTQPDMVLVVPADATDAGWKNRTVWHSRTQFFTATSSAYLIGEEGGDKSAPFSSAGFSALGDFNKSGIVYHYIAIADSDDSDMDAVSWIGNATGPRDIDFTDEQFDAVFVKRDSPQPSIWRAAASSVAISATLNAGTNSKISAINADGITVDGSDEVNENNNAGRGEGIGGVAWKTGDLFEVQRFAGTGAEKTLSFSWAVAAAIVLDETNDADAEPHKIKTKGMSGDDAKPFGGVIAASGVTISGSDLTLSASANVSGNDYVVIAMRDQQEEQTRTLPTGTALRNAEEVVTIDDAPALSGPATIEFWGAYDITRVSTWYVPLIMLGSADAGTNADSAGTYNGGLYIYSYDPDVHGWEGGVIRVFTGDYFAPTKSESSINYHNWNTGIVIPSVTPFHLVVTHHGAGDWRVFLNGVHSKLRDFDLDTAEHDNRTNGGAGAAVTSYLLSGNDPSVDTIRGASGRCVRAAFWDSALTDAQAVARYQNALGAAWSGPSPDKEYDFRGGALPSGISGPTRPLFSDVEATTPHPVLIGQGNADAPNDVVVTQSDGDTTFDPQSTKVYSVVFHPGVHGTFNLRSHLGLSGESRVICRIDGTKDGDRDGFPGEGDIFDVTMSSDIDRTDEVTLARQDQFIAYRIVPSAANNTVTVKSTTGPV